MVRSGNEDNFLILDLSSGQSWTANEEEPHELLTYGQGYYGTLLAVSDGMGGALAGEVASRMAVETVRDRMLQLQAHDVYGKMPFHERMRLAVEEANLVIHADGQTNQAHRGLGATFTAVGINSDHLYFAQVGDSRAYLIRQGNIERVTKDQSLVQQLIDAGQITEEEAETHSYRNVILQALGAHNNVNVEVNKVLLCQMDTLVLCSDGLSGKMHGDEIAGIVNAASDFKSACQSLISLANERGGEDNITVVVAQFSGSGLPLPNGSIEPQSLARSPDTPSEINWNTGAKTDPLDQTEKQAGNQANNQAASQPNAAQRATEPLPIPPKQATPFTAPLQRELPGRRRTNDLSDRVEPITAVFSVEDFEGDLQHSEQLAEQLAEQSAESVAGQASSQTAPLGSRHTAPLTAEMPALSAKPDSSPSNNGSQAQQKNSKTNLVIFIGLLILGITGLVFVATTYISRQKAETEAQQRENARLNEEAQKERQGSIEQVRNKITMLRNKLGASAKPSLESKLEGWRSKLSDFDRQLDELSNESADKTKTVCTEIEREIQKIDEEFNSAQGLIPLRNTNRFPVKL